MQLNTKYMRSRLCAYFRRRAFPAEILTFFCSAMLSRILLIGEISPLGIAFFAAAWMAHHNPFYPFAGVILGSLLCPVIQWFNICTAAFFLLLGLLWRLWRAKLPNSIKLLLFGASNLLAFPLFFFRSLDDCMIGILCSVTTVALAIIMQHALRIINKFPLQRILADEEQLSLCFLFGILLMGLTDIAFLGFSLPVMLASLGVLFITYAKGLISLAIAVAIGALLTLSGHVGLLFIGNIAICTFAALICRRLGRWGISIAFFVCNIMIGSYIGSGLQYTILPQSLVPALAIFLAVPKNTMLRLRGYVDLTARSEHQTHTALTHLCAHTAQQISCTADAFDEISTLLDTQPEASNPEIWRMREEEQRTFLHMQLRGVCNVMRSLAQRMKESTYPNEHLTALLKRNLPAHLHVRDILVFQTNERLHVRLQVPKSVTDHAAILTYIQQILGIPMRLLTTHIQMQRNVLEFEEARMLRCVMGTAAMPLVGQAVSGDSMGERQLANGKAIFALSDGMGSGMKAKKESEHTLDLLFQLYQAGFEGDTALPCVNRLLKNRSDQEIYATLDMLSLDLESGHAEFIKFGAPASFVLRAGTVHTVYAEALPAGIIDEALPAIHAAHIQKGDTIILMTDGMFDVFGDDIGNEILVCVGGANTVKDGAQALLASARMRHPQDDMSVMVIRIF